MSVCPCSAHQKCYKICATYTSTSLLLQFLIFVQRNTEHLLNHTLQNVTGLLQARKRQRIVWQQELAVARWTEYEKFIVVFSPLSRYFVFSEISLVSLLIYVKCLIICPLLNKILLPRLISIKFSIIKFLENPATFFHDGQTDVKKLLVAFHHFVNASKRRISWLNFMKWHEITVQMYTRNM